MRAYACVQKWGERLPGQRLFAESQAEVLLYSEPYQSEVELDGPDGQKVLHLLGVSVAFELPDSVLATHEITRCPIDGSRRFLVPANVMNNLGPGARCN